MNGAAFVAAKELIYLARIGRDGLGWTVHKHHDLHMGLYRTREVFPCLYSVVV